MAEKFAALTDDQLRRLAPEERIAYLKRLEAFRRKKLEEERLKAEEEIGAAKDLIRDTEEEEEEEREVAEERVARREEEDLERIVADEKVSREAQEKPYQTGAEQYRLQPGLEQEIRDRYTSGGRSDEYRFENLGREDDRLYRMNVEGAPGEKSMGDDYMSPSMHREGLSTNILKDMYKRGE